MPTADPPGPDDPAAFHFRGSFACVGSDDRIHGVEAIKNDLGELWLTLDDGRPVVWVDRGVYRVEGSPSLRLFCDHPDAP